MTETRNLSRFASKANAVFNSITANSTALTSITVGNVAINATAIVVSDGARLLANGSFGVAGDVLTSNGTGLYWSAASATGSPTNTFTVGTASYFVANGNVGIGNTAPDARLAVTGTANISGNVVVGGSLNAANVTATVFTGSLTGTASNATNLNSQPGSFYTNATNLATGTVPTARLGTGTANSTTFLGGDQTYKTAVTSVATDSGLTGGPITTTGTVSVLANNGITANATGLYVTQGTGAVVNSTGVHVNSAYIATIAANSATGSLTNTFTIGTAAYFVANGNVGIGNTTPAHKLRVQGDISLSGGIHANGSLGNSGDVLQSNGSVAYWAASSGGDIPSGTAMLFVQTTAPTGWTKSTTHNNKALRVVSGVAGSGGTVEFTTAFASKSVTGTIDNTIAGGTIANTIADGTVSTSGTIANTIAGGTVSTSGTIANATAGGTVSTSGTIANATAGGTISVSGTVGATTLTTTQIPSHSHPFGTNVLVNAGSSLVGQGSTPSLYATTTDSSTDSVGSGGSHNHTFSGSGTFTGTSHGHTLSASSSFTGTTHGHTLSASSSFTGTTHGHTMSATSTFSGITHGHTFTGITHGHTFTGTAIDLAVQYVDVIIATKD